MGDKRGEGKLSRVEKSRARGRAACLELTLTKAGGG